MSQPQSALPGLRQCSRPFSWPLLLILLIFAIISMACRLEFGVAPGNGAGAQTAPALAVPAGSVSVAQRAAQSQPPAQADAVPVAPSATPSPAPTATRLPSPTPTITPTPPALLEPTVVARKEIVLPAGLNIKPTATIVALQPARYPPAEIIVPAINLDAPVEPAGWEIIQENGQQVSMWDVPDAAAGWHENSALPGHGSNVVLSGHHNMGKEVFRDLVDLKVGDEIVLQADAYRYHYQVTDRFIVPELNAPPEQQQQNSQWILPTIDERITLVTCWPYQGNSHRLIVVAKPVGFEEL